MPSKVWDEVTYPFPNFCTAEVLERIRNFIPHFLMDVTTPCKHLNDWTTETGGIYDRDFARFEFKMTFGRISYKAYITQGP